jgi:hypothetical protein
VIFKGAGGAVALTCADYSAPPKTGTSNTFVVNPGPFAGLQVILPGQTAAGGTATGKTGTPTNQTAGTPFTITVRAVDQYWNLVSGVNDNIHLVSTDAFAWMPADTTLQNGQCLIQVRLHKSGNQTITASDNDNSSILTDTSSQVLISGGPSASSLILAPGESPAWHGERPHRHRHRPVDQLRLHDHGPRHRRLVESGDGSDGRGPHHLQ